MVIYYSNRLKGDGFNKQFIYSDLGDRRCFYMGWKKFTYARPETKTLKLSSCGKTINYWFSYFLLYIAVNLSCWLDKNNTFIYFLPKTLNNFNYYVKKPTAGEKVKIKLRVRKYNPSTRKHEWFVEKKLPPHSK